MSVHPEPTESPPSRAQLERFRGFVLDDVAPHESLRRVNDRQAFTELVVDAGRRHGFAFAAQDVSAALQATHLQMLGAAPRRVRETRLPPDGWLPACGFWQDGELYVEWAYFGARPLRESFFEESLRRSAQSPFDLLFRYATPIARLAEWLQARPGLRPRGFIFHMSRCGSTLVSQMLASLAHNLVISEAPALDAVVQAGARRRGLTAEQHAFWLTWMVGALGQPRCGEQALFLKLDSWHTLALPLFRRAFPTVPWVFLYRDPVEVLVSQMRVPGIQTVPELAGAGVLGGAASYEPHGREDYCARILARICEPALEHCRDGGARLINYRELPAATWTSILPHFGVACSERERATMAAAARRDAKAPGAPFRPDAEDKQQAATPAIRSAARERLGDIYARLEASRRETL